MSTTPIFDATLADAPRNIWEASSIFPRPINIRVQTFAPDFRDYSYAPLQPAFTDWSAVQQRWEA